ncbi:ElaA protein [Nocardioides psychrotolerans]|uniref:ElaA protein n=1 Tax=Nocardioides psychrotolerans TaxID=1005945 RepID=A0A1I3MZW5_9ACTN|nr:GNAT family N-acetyltransferase [Nocardioides psychrotolerans]GEP39076.1 ElaA protein [Nocardioides psychrotolerans]SFJ02553.1 ElaA protein [Nocardioides psychrotolerans]
MNIAAIPFATLDPAGAYAVWRLRQEVFVVEQECPYPDLDGRDTEPGTRHVLLRAGEDDGDLLGYARVLDDPTVWRIGRVVLAPGARGRGLAAPLMETALSVCPDREVVLDAQSPLASFYAGFGFVVEGEEFLEDGIAHLPMRRPLQA